MWFCCGDGCASIVGEGGDLVLEHEGGGLWGEDACLCEWGGAVVEEGGEDFWSGG